MPQKPKGAPKCPANSEEPKSPLATAIAEALANGQPLEKQEQLDQVVGQRQAAMMVLSLFKDTQHHRVPEGLSEVFEMPGSSLPPL